MEPGGAVGRGVGVDVGVPGVAVGMGDGVPVAAGCSDSDSVPPGDRIGVDGVWVGVSVKVDVGVVVGGSAGGGSGSINAKKTIPAAMMRATIKIVSNNLGLYRIIVSPLVVAGEIEYEMDRIQARGNRVS